MMFFPMPRGFDPTLTPQHKEILKKLTVTEDVPGSVLHDYDAIIKIVREGNLPATQAHQLPLKALPLINENLKNPIEHGLKRPQQKSYPHIHGLYLLARASGAIEIDTAGKKPKLKAPKSSEDEPRFNPTERYFILLEIWLIWAQGKLINERIGWGESVGDNFMRVAPFYFKIPDKGLRLRKDMDTYSLLNYSPMIHNLGLMELFGLITIKRGDVVPGEGWQYKSIHRTPFGDALLRVLYAELLQDIDGFFNRMTANNLSFGMFQPMFQPYFPEWKENLAFSEWEFRDGKYVFKVTLGKILRRIAVKGSDSFATLASIILDSVEFDHDHLYVFILTGLFGHTQSIYHPYMEDEGMNAAKTRIGGIALEVGQSVLFRFDFGDNWEFDVTLESVDIEAKLKQPIILESKGDAPEQYPIWDDEW